jgi:branched-chain amino acid transport system substrate-binding protein
MVKLQSVSTTSIGKKTLISAIIATMMASSIAPAMAQSKGYSDGAVKIGIIPDMTGLYSDITGTGSVTAVRMAIEDFGGKLNGKPIELVFADHQNKADIASSKAREWFDNDKVDAIMDVAASATALAVVKVAKEKNKIAFFSGPGALRISNEDCTANTVHYAYDTYALANVTGKAIVQKGGDSWYFLTADYAFGKSLEQDTSDVVKANGGKVLGSVKHPLSASDFSSYLFSAQSSGAKVIGLANAGGDTINSIKAAKEFAITKSGKQQLAGLLMFISDIHSLGLETAQGLMLTESFYWDMNDETRKWSRRYFDKMKRMPGMAQAGAYSSTLNYLKAVQAAGTDDTATVMAKLKSTPINDMFVKNGRIREDGRMIRDMYLFQVKSPSEAKYAWDYYKLLATVPGDQAFMPLSKSACPLVKK